MQTRVTSEGHLGKVGLGLCRLLVSACLPGERGQTCARADPGLTRHRKSKWLLGIMLPSQVDTLPPPPWSVPRHLVRPGLLHPGLPWVLVHSSLLLCPPECPFHSLPGKEMPEASAVRPDSSRWDLMGSGEAKAGDSEQGGLRSGRHLALGLGVRVRAGSRT